MTCYLYFQNGPLAGLRSLEVPDDWEPPPMFWKLEALKKGNVILGELIAGPPMKWQYHRLGKITYEGIEATEYVGQGFSPN